jgi:hypothetical protein
MEEIKQFVSDKELKEEIRKQFLKDTEASEIYGTAVQTFRNWRYEGKGPAYVKIGSSILYDRKDLDNYWAEHRIIPAQEAA